RKIVPRNFRLRSMRTYSVFFWSYSNSTHDPRYGMILPRKYVRLFAVSKKTPGERCNWLTITRSVPFTMNVPFWVMSGMSPKKTSCSLMSRILFAPVSASLSKMVRRMVTLSGAEYVMPLFAFVYVVLELQSDRVAALVAEIGSVGVVGSAFSAENFAGVKRIGDDRGSAITTGGAQVVETLEVSALA